MLEKIKNTLNGYIKSSNNGFIRIYRILKKVSFTKKYINRFLSDIKYDYDGIHYACGMYQYLKNKVNLDSVYENDTDKFIFTRIFMGINSVSVSASTIIDGVEAEYMISFFNDTDRVRVITTNKTELGTNSRSYEITAPIVKEDSNDNEYLILSAFVIMVQKFIIEYLKV